MNTTRVPYRRLCRTCCKPASVHPWHGCDRFAWMTPTSPPTPDYLAARRALTAKETA